MKCFCVGFDGIYEAGIVIVFAEAEADVSELAMVAIRKEFSEDREIYRIDELTGEEPSAYLLYNGDFQV